MDREGDETKLKTFQFQFCLYLYSLKRCFTEEAHCYMLLGYTYTVTKGKTENTYIFQTVDNFFFVWLFIHATVSSYDFDCTYLHHLTGCEQRKWEKQSLPAFLRSISNFIYFFFILLCSCLHCTTTKNINYFIRGPEWRTPYTKPTMNKKKINKNFPNKNTSQRPIDIILFASEIIFIGQVFFVFYSRHLFQWSHVLCVCLGLQTKEGEKDYEYRMVVISCIKYMEILNDCAKRTLHIEKYT